MIASKSLTLLAFLSASLLVSGCATKEQSHASLVGGATGTVVGAGTGAAIGAAISNGDIAASTLLGAGVGLGVGVVGGLAYHAMAESDQVEENADAISANQDEITRKQRELDRYRENLFKDTQEIELDESRKEYRYEGASLGNYYR